MAYKMFAPGDIALISHRLLIENPVCDLDDPKRWADWADGVITMAEEIMSAFKEGEGV